MCMSYIWWVLSPISQLVFLLEYILWVKETIYFGQYRSSSGLCHSNKIISCVIGLKPARWYIINNGDDTIQSMVYMFYDAPYVIFPLIALNEKENVEVPGALLLDVRLSLPPVPLHHPSTA
jgi:hypothetical protein